MNNHKQRFSYNIEVNGKPASVEFPLNWAIPGGCYKEQNCNIIQQRVCPNKKMYHACKHPVYKYKSESWDLILPLINGKFTGKNSIVNDFININKRRNILDSYQEVGENVIKAPMCVFKQDSHKSIGFVGQIPFPGVLAFTNLPDRNGKIKYFKSIYRPESKGSCSSDFLAKAYVKIGYAANSSSMQWIVPPSSEPLAGSLASFITQNYYTGDNETIADKLALVDLLLLQLQQVEDCIKLVQAAPPAKQAEYIYWFIGFTGLYYAYLSGITGAIEEYFHNEQFSDGIQSFFAAQQLKQRIELVRSFRKRGLLKVFRARTTPKLLTKLFTIKESLKNEIMHEQELFNEDPKNLDYNDYLAWRWVFFGLINDIVTAVLEKESNQQKKFNENKETDSANQFSTVIAKVKKWEDIFSSLWNVKIIQDLRL